MVLLALRCLVSQSARDYVFGLAALSSSMEPRAPECRGDVYFQLVECCTAAQLSFLTLVARRRASFLICTLYLTCPRRGAAQLKERLIKKVIHLEEREGRQTNIKATPCCANE